MPGNVNLLIHKRFAIPGTEGYIDMNDDEVVHDMFCMYEGQLVINIKVFNMDIIPVEQPAMLLNRKIDGDHEHIEIQNKHFACSDEQNVHVIDSEDEGYGCESSPNESWKQGFDDDNEDDIGDELMAPSDSDSSDEDFPEFDDNDVAEIVPDSEFVQEIDSLREVLRSKIWTYNPRDDIDFKKGQLFTNVDAFRAALKDYVIQKGFPIKRLKNQKTRCTAICDVDGCSWRIHASPVADSVTFMIKSYTLEDTCVMDNKNREATSDWMAKKLVAVMRTYPYLSRKGIEAEMLKYDVHSSKQQVYTVKQEAREEIERTHSELYSKLPKYAVLLRQHNLGSVCKIHYDRPNLLVEPRFLRLFISFKGQKDGFLAGCRSFIRFDGCHLKGSFDGVLLIVVALDANNSIFPIAFAIAEVENKETWSWFFHFFEEFFRPLHSNIPLTCMSDRQKGLNLAYEQLLPSVIEDTIAHIFASIKDMNIEAWRYLSKIPISAWARHAFSIEMKCDHVTNNFMDPLRHALDT
nr:uncharacterized protein LOC113718339 [Coffea arabica]